MFSDTLDGIFLASGSCETCSSDLYDFKKSSTSLNVKNGATELNIGGTTFPVYMYADTICVKEGVCVNNFNFYAGTLATPKLDDSNGLIGFSPYGRYSIVGQLAS